MRSAFQFLALKKCTQRIALDYIIEVHVITNLFPDVTEFLS